jgi:hypothetical protein
MTGVVAWRRPSVGDAAMALAISRLAAALMVMAARPDPRAACPDCAEAARRARQALQDASTLLAWVDTGGARAPRTAQEGPQEAAQGTIAPQGMPT